LAGERFERLPERLDIPDPEVVAAGVSYQSAMVPLRLCAAGGTLRVDGECPSGQVAELLGAALHEDGHLTALKVLADQLGDVHLDLAVAVIEVPCESAGGEDPVAYERVGDGR
jgi:hypothetical protein